VIPPVCFHTVIVLNTFPIRRQANKYFYENECIRIKSVPATLRNPFIPTLERGRH